MLDITDIFYSKSGTRIDYKYNCEDSILKYFNRKDNFFCEYDQQITTVPKSITIIPLLANVVPISWFAGFNVKVVEIDEDFFYSLERIKIELQKSYPSVDFRLSTIRYEKLVKNTYSVKKNSMLFSGGVDAYATYFRHFKEDLDLITVRGADITLDDHEEWNRVVALNEAEILLKKNLKYYVKANLREFYTHRVDLLLPNLGWWGKVQHGLALNALVAPLSYLNGYYTNYIASSYTKEIDISWGSSPMIDDKITWGSTIVKHDGYELKRQDKIDFILKLIDDQKHIFSLRVCYSTLKKGANCSKCEKCYRTILAIILNNKDPNNYGFAVNKGVYDDILAIFHKGFSSKGMKYFWWEILQKINSTENLFIFDNEDLEREKMKKVAHFIQEKLDQEEKKLSAIDKMKFIVQNTFPTLFKYYLKIRQKQI